MTVVPNRHTLGPLLDNDDSKIFRMIFRDGRNFRLRGFSRIDSSVYDQPDGWCVAVVEFVSPRDDFDRRLYPSGSGLDIYESDLLEVVNEKTGASVLVAKSSEEAPGDAV